jgi:chitosanase
MLDDAARQQAGVSRVQDTLAAVLAAEETGSRTPDYQQITVDSGGITYGAYQADRRSGELAKLIREYVRNATPTAETRALARHADALEGGRGAALDRSSELKRLLRNAGNDPVMQQAQTGFFRAHHLEPALAKAAAAGIRSPLGASVWLDLTVNGGLDSVVAAARRVVPRIVTPADEARFIKAMIDARERRYRNLAANGMRKYLPGWLSRNNDFRKLLAAGNLDLAGNVPLPAKGFAICGGSTTDAAAFRSWMASLARPS